MTGSLNFRKYLLQIFFSEVFRIIEHKISAELKLYWNLIRFEAEEEGSHCDIKILNKFI